MALLVTLFLVLVNIFNAITTNSPKADGLNALQVSRQSIERQLYRVQSRAVGLGFNTGKGERN